MSEDCIEPLLEVKVRFCLEDERSRLVLYLEDVVARVAILDVGRQLVDGCSRGFARVHSNVRVAQNDAREDLILCKTQTRYVSRSESIES